MNLLQQEAEAIFAFREVGKLAVESNKRGMN